MLLRSKNQPKNCLSLFSLRITTSVLIRPLIPSNLISQAGRTRQPEAADSELPSHCELLSRAAAARDGSSESRMSISVCLPVMQAHISPHACTTNENTKSAFIKQRNAKCLLQEMCWRLNAVYFLLPRV